MTTTVKSIIKKAMQKSGILTKTEEPAADEASDALDALNAMLSSWSNDSMLVYARTWETFDLIGGIGTYTIGPGGDFDTVRPIEVIAATVRIGSTEEPVDIITDEIYAEQIALKTQPGLPLYLNYDNQFPLAKIRLWPIPSTNYPLFLLTEKLLSQFSIDDEVDLPPGWERALIFNLAIEIASDYGPEPPRATVAIAGKSIGMIRKAVNRNRSLDATPRNGNRGNIYSGWWNR